MDREVTLQRNGHHWDVEIDPKKSLEDIILDLDSRDDPRRIKAATLIVTEKVILLNIHTTPPQP